MDCDDGKSRMYLFQAVAYHFVHCNLETERVTIFQEERN